MVLMKIDGEQWRKKAHLRNEDFLWKNLIFV
jgi:hypothetical protein